MNSQELKTILVEPIIHYPRYAEPGKTYLLKIDLRPNSSGDDWPYDREEYVVHCHVDAGAVFHVQSLGEPDIVVHRFGGTYGPAMFQLMAKDTKAEGLLRITLVNAWGVPLDVIELGSVKIQGAAAQLARAAGTPMPRYGRLKGSTFMPMNILVLTLGVATSRAAEALVVRAAERKPGLLQQAQSLFKFAQDLPASSAEEAVRRAVKAARQEMLDRIRRGELNLEPRAADELVVLLEHPTFAGDVTNQVLFGGQPSFDRLADVYITQPRRTGQTSARWERLEEPLLDFFKAIKTHLQADPQFGLLVRDVERLATLARLDNTDQIIAEASQQAALVQERIAQSSRRGTASLETLVQIAARQAVTYQAQQLVTLAQIHNLLARVLDVLGEAAPPPATPGGYALTLPENAYLGSLRERCNRLPLALAYDRRGQDPHAHGQVSLANVYVDLQTTSSPTWGLVFDRLGVPDKERPRLRKALKSAGEKGAGARAAVPLEVSQQAVGELLRGGHDDFEKHPLRPWARDEAALRAAMDRVTALDALAGSPVLVLLGKPGSGKSTLVNHIAYTMASGLLDLDVDWQAVLGPTFATPWFPLRVVLRQWSASLEPGSQAGHKLVYEALAQATGLTDQSALLARLAQPDTLVLFDGLDEVPVADSENADTFDRRRVIIDSVQDFIAAHRTCRILVTSRVKPYREGDYQLAGVPVFELADLDDGRIERFIQFWYDELVRVGRKEQDAASSLRSRLHTALGQRRVLREMAGTPLLLTMLAQVNSWAGLPESRAELYHDCVEQLLWEWEKHKQTGPEGGPSALSLDKLLDEGSTICGVPITRGDIERKLWTLTYQAHGSSGGATVDLPASTIEHRLAEVCPRRVAGIAWASRVVDLMAERGGLLIETESGHFTFPSRSFQEYLAACGLLENENRLRVAFEHAGSEAWSEVVLLACGELKRTGRFDETQHLIFELASGEDETPEDWRRLVVAGQAWLEFGPHRADLASGRQLIRELPTRLVRLMQNRTVPPRLRLDAGLIAADLGDRPADLDSWVGINARKKVGYDFKIGKYPVTNLQFRRFVNEGGYKTTQPWWEPKAVEEIKRYWEGWPVGPRYWGHPAFDKLTQPVVGISWYEAVAYTRWLTGKLRADGQIGAHEEVRLPTEVEWVWVAGGAENRPYPWGRTFDEWRANTKESELDQTSPVHMYSDGATPEGVWDLAGNVWEWITDVDKDGWRWVRGGAYWSNDSSIGSAARDPKHPWNSNVLCGFRLVVAPIDPVWA